VSDSSLTDKAAEAVDGATDSASDAAESAKADVAKAADTVKAETANAVDTAKAETSKATAAVTKQTAAAADTVADTADDVASKADAAAAKASEKADAAKADVAGAEAEKKPAPPRSMDEIEAELEATRERLAGRIDDLTDYVKPANVVERQKNKLKSVFVDEYGGIKPDRVLIAAGIVVAVVGLSVLRRRRRRS